jgi:hypothetical protein
MSENSARIICEDVLAIDRNILGISIADMNGHLLSSSSNHSMEGRLENSVSEKCYGLWG